MMILKQKVLRNAGGRLKLCLIIPLANGAKLQYPVHSEAEAWSLYEQHMQLNAVEQLPCGAQAVYP